MRSPLSYAQRQQQQHHRPKMSHVRLSNASPTVERVDARQTEGARPPVRRNLFGTPDPEETRRYLEASVREGVRAFRETYNYDPESDKPLPGEKGRFEWQEDRDAPEFFSRPPHSRPRSREEVDLGGERSRRDSGDTTAVLHTDKHRDGSRKRRSGAPGPECPSKKSLTDEEEEDELAQWVKAAEAETGKKPENSEQEEE